MMKKNKMRMYRKERGLSLYDVAHETMLSPGYLCHLEIGTRLNPSNRVMKAIAKSLGKSIYEIFFCEESDTI